MGVVRMAINLESQELSTGVQIFSPLLADCIALVILYVPQHLKIRPLEGCIRIIVEVVELSLADLHNSNIVTYINMTGLSKLHERIKRLEDR